MVLLKMGRHARFHLSFYKMVGVRRNFVVVTKLIKKLRVFGFGGAFSKLETFVWILNHVSRSITWCLFSLKTSIPVKWLPSTWSFFCQLTEWLKFGTRPSSLRNFGMTYKIYTVPRKKETPENRFHYPCDMYHFKYYKLA